MTLARRQERHSPLSKWHARWSRRMGTAALLGLAAVSRAGAADLGANCCADLEERIAELEATTARKGNRQVSVVISGTINQSALTWDDGKASNIYTVTNDNY